MRKDSLFRQMRIILLYDLPTTTKANITIYTIFRRELLKLGFVMMQESVYVKSCLNHDWVNRTMLKIEKITPKQGDVRLIVVTEKQYEQIRILRGEKSLQEQYTNTESLVII